MKRSLIDIFSEKQASLTNYGIVNLAPSEAAAQAIKNNRYDYKPINTGKVLVYTDSNKDKVKLIDSQRFVERREVRPLMNLLIRPNKDCQIYLNEYDESHLISLKKGIIYNFSDVKFFMLSPDWTDDNLAYIKITGYAPPYYESNDILQICPILLWANCDVEMGELYYYDIRTLSSMYYFNMISDISFWRWDTSCIEDMSNMFSTMSNLTGFYEFDYMDTSSCIDMSYMFSGDYNLTSLDLSTFNTSNVQTTEHMFYSCSSLTTLNLSGWDLSSCTMMDDMFAYCKSITTLTLSEGFGKMQEGASAVDFGAMTSWTNDSVKTLLTLYDRKTNGLSTIVLILSQNTYNALGSDNIATLKSRGYDVRVV